MPIGPAPTVISVTAAGGKYYMDGVEQGFVDLDPGTTYVFDVSDGSMGFHPLAFSTTEDGTHGGGAEYADADYSVAADGTVTLVVDDSTPVLYYYCEAHDEMGGHGRSRGRSLTRVSVSCLPTETSTPELLAGLVTR